MGLRAAVAVLLGHAVGAIAAGRALSGGHIAALLVLPLVAAVVERSEVASYGRRQAELEPVERHRVLRTVWHRGIRDRQNQRSGPMVSLATDSVERAAAMRASFSSPIIGKMTAPIVVLVVMGFTVGARPALTLAIALPLIPIVVGGFQSIFRKVSTRHREASAGLASHFLEALQGLSDLRILDAGARFGRHLAEHAELLRRHVMSMLAANQVVIFVADAGFSLSMVVVALWLALDGVASGALDLSRALILVLLAPLLMEPLNHIGSFFYVGMGGRAAARALRSFAEDDATSRPSLDEAAPVGTGEALAVFLRDVTFGWNADHPVVSGVSLQIAPGEHVAITGESGGGKSTLLALIEGVIEPDSGSVELDGRVLPGAERRRWCSSVHQSAFLFTGNLRENLLMARPESTDDELWEALYRANLAEDVSAWPAGLQTEIGERALQVSGGQAQRIAIARAFLRDAPVLLLDEPTSQVDLASEHAIRAALDELRRGRTVITVAHRPALVDAADRAIEIRAGHVVGAESAHG